MTAVAEVSRSHSTLFKKNKGRAEHEVKGLKECNFDEEKDADNEGTKTIGLGKR
jgi:hypothetical protein